MNPNANQWNPYQEQQNYSNYNPYGAGTHQQEEYYDYGMNYNSYEQAGQYDYDETTGGGDSGMLHGISDYALETQTEEDTGGSSSPGLFYPLTQPYIPHIQSAPISAVAIDPLVNAIYVAGHTITLNKKRRHATYSTPATSSNAPGSSGISRNTSSSLGSIDQRVSMLATHSYPDGSLYSAVAGHVEARQEVLNDIASALYGEKNDSVSTRRTTQPRQKLPKHAYRPPYNRPMDEAQKAALILNSYQSTNYQMGINKILPFSSQVASGLGGTKNEGYVCTISPASVRMHSQGGLLLSENKIEGLITGTFHPSVYHGGNDDQSIASNATHITVGGISCKTYTSHGIPGINSPNLYCMDLYSSSLKTVASHTARGVNGSACCITDVTTCYETGNIIAGVSDGTLRIFDGTWRGSSCIECARVKAHGGGVAQIAVKGNLICTTGFSSRRSVGYSSDNLYAFPDEHVLVFDIRYLGRGGLAHPTSVFNGGPRFVSFLPAAASSASAQDSSDCRILIGSGQIDGGLQVITPFQGLMESEAQFETENFIKPPLSPEWEMMTAMQVMGKDLLIGTSIGNVLQYRMKDGDKTKHNPGGTSKDFFYERNSQESVGYSEVGHGSKANNIDDEDDFPKSHLELPSYKPDPPALTIDPAVLANDHVHNREIPYSVFNSYILQQNAGVSSVCDEMGKPNPYSFGLMTDTIVNQESKRKLSKKLQDLVTVEKDTEDFLVTIPTSKLGIDLGMKSESYFPNTNKLLHDDGNSKVCYDTEADPRKRDRRVQKMVGDDLQLPPRYAKKTRPLNSRFSAFDFSALNNTLYPGWDYNGPNAFVSPVILLLYFVPEIHSIMLRSQLKNFDAIVTGKRSGKGIDELGSELGFLFHLINSLASHAMVYPKPPGDIEDRCRPVLGAFTPSNFLSTFVSMPEASALALLDGHPAATEVERRPEAFYRFLLHHLDKEIDKQSNRRSTKTPSASSKKNLIDSLFGMNAVSMNEFVNEGAGSQSTVTVTRSNTVDLAYEAFLNKDNEVTNPPDFGELLRFSLCKEVPLRAWCNSTKSFETVIQRKIITSLPTIMSLSCSCAGINGEERLPIWRKTETDYDHWLPEFFEVEIEDDGNIITRQLRGAKWEEFQSDNPSKWEEFRGDDLSSKVTEKLQNAMCNTDGGKRIARYSLQAILTFVNTDAVDTTDCNNDERGHHVLHVRVPGSHRKQTLLSQLEVTNNHLTLMSKKRNEHLTLIRNVTEEDLKKRIDVIKQQLEEFENNENADEWVLFNGPSVSSTILEDALAFQVPFKEPCILTYRQIDSIDASEKPMPSKVHVDTRIMHSPMISGGDEISNISDIVAFDAEFVQVQLEDAILTATGSKMILREGRNALGRMSLIDFRTGKTIVDDHVLPREPVVDYLTRFSGIKPTDLNPKTSPHYLITSKHAYLKMRYLVERGCIFVGHGLTQDFLTVNIFVPPAQIIDTTDIYHLDRRRLISLRFLVNYLLGRDMQQDVHDSIEDSIAACELYIKALELKKAGKFETVLHEIYECGHKIDWKVGELRRLRDHKRL